MEGTAKLALIEAVQPEIAPIADQVNDLLNESIEKIAQSSIGEINALTKNLGELGTQMLNAAAAAKEKINKLHELNGQIAAEVRRGEEMRRSVSDSIERISSP
jgi:hypothetical protein